MAPKERSHASRNAPRRKRAQIASQACQRCRSRRTKCDEQKPQCASCQAQGVSCIYQESSSARLEQVEETVAGLTSAFDGVKARLDLFLTARAPVSDASPKQLEMTDNVSPSSSAVPARQSVVTRPGAIGTLSGVRAYLTVPHRVVLWPCMRILLTASGLQAASDLAHISQQGTQWFIRREIAKHPRSFPSTLGATASHALTSQEAQRDALPGLTANQVMEYTQAYFRTFNVLIPILDYQTFVDVTLKRLGQEGYAFGDLDAVVALLVFALGELAAEGIFGEPISTHTNGIASGFRGGDVNNPPGLHLFNEARKRSGFVDSLCTLENVQIFLLQATYFEANSHHLEFWKSTTTASSTMHALLKSQQFDWTSRIGDLTSRAFWACLFQEDLYHLDLDLPPSGIQQYEDDVPLPLFQSLPTPHDSYSEEKERSYFKHHFLAMIALRRLIVRIHGAVHDISTVRAESADDYSGAPTLLIREMGRQLSSWRSLLPPALQWLDEDRFVFPSLASNDLRGSPSSFITDETTTPVGYEHNIDMLTAQLRTRYYYAQYVLCRPLVYKALHFPEQMTASDAHYCALAVNSMCLWPSLMAPPKAKKRLVPHLFAWTQNFLGMLLIFKAIQSSDYMARICQQQGIEVRMQETIALMLDWIRDAKQVDGTAEWSWTIMEWMFRDDYQKGQVH